MAISQRLTELRLSQVPIFCHLRAETIHQLAQEATVINLSRGSYLWRRGDRPDAVAVILTGRIDVCRNTKEGGRMLLRVLGPPTAVGLSTVAGEPHTADLVAGMETRAAVIAGPVMRRMYSSQPKAALAALAQLGDLLGKLTDEVEELRFRDLDGRLMACVRRHAERDRVIRLTHEEFAQQIGATRANVSRALKRLERRGVLLCLRGRVEVLSQ